MDGYGWVLTREVADDDSCGIVLYVGKKRLGEVSHLQTRKRKVAVSSLAVFYLAQLIIPLERFFSCLTYS